MALVVSTLAIMVASFALTLKEDTGSVLPLTPPMLLMLMPTVETTLSLLSPALILTLIGLATLSALESSSTGQSGPTAMTSPTTALDMKISNVERSVNELPVIMSFFTLEVASLETSGALASSFEIMESLTLATSVILTMVSIVETMVTGVTVLNGQIQTPTTSAIPAEVVLPTVELIVVTAKLDTVVVRTTVIELVALLIFGPMSSI